MNTPKLISALVETCKALGAESIRVSLFDSGVSPVHLSVSCVSDVAAKQVAEAFGVTLKRRVSKGETYLDANEIRDGVYVCVNGPLAPVTPPIDDEKVGAALVSLGEAVAS